MCDGEHLRLNVIIDLHGIALSHHPLALVPYRLEGLLETTLSQAGHQDDRVVTKTEYLPCVEIGQRVEQLMHGGVEGSREAQVT